MKAEGKVFIDKELLYMISFAFGDIDSEATRTEEYHESFSMPSEAREVASIVDGIIHSLENPPTSRPDLYASWLEANAAETQALEARRAIEDTLIAELEIDPQLDGTVSGEEDGFKIKVVGRLTHKVDATEAMAVAKGHTDLVPYLETVFRWKPELAMAAWEQAPEHVRLAFSRAITTSAGRPSISIERLTAAEKE